MNLSYSIALSKSDLVRLTYFKRSSLHSIYIAYQRLLVRGSTSCFHITREYEMF